MKSIDWEDLKVFIHVARGGGLSAAAAELGLEPGDGRPPDDRARARGGTAAVRAAPERLRAHRRRPHAACQGARHGGRGPADRGLAGGRRRAVGGAALGRNLDGQLLLRQFLAAMDARRPVPHRLQDDGGTSRHRPSRGRDRHPQQRRGGRQPRFAAHGHGRLCAVPLAQSPYRPAARIGWRSRRRMPPRAPRAG